MKGGNQFPFYRMILLYHPFLRFGLLPLPYACFFLCFQDIYLGLGQPLLMLVLPENEHVNLAVIL